MLNLDAFATVLTAPGPYATAYLDATRSKELGPQEVDKRWRALRASLAEQGADDATLDAMEAAVGGHEDVPGPHGQLLVAAGGAVRYDVGLPEVPRREGAHWAPLPHLMPAVAQLGARVPYVLALVDRVGADVTVVGPDHSAVEQQTVAGSTYPIQAYRLVESGEICPASACSKLSSASARPSSSPMGTAPKGWATITYRSSSSS